MLQWMRNAQTWVIKGVLLAVVLAFVVTIFYQWGVRSGGGPTRSEVATIFGQPISIREFQNVYNALQQQYRAIFRMQRWTSTPSLISARWPWKSWPNAPSFCAWPSNMGW